MNIFMQVRRLALLCFCFFPLKIHQPRPSQLVWEPGDSRQLMSLLLCDKASVARLIFDELSPAYHGTNYHTVHMQGMAAPRDLLPIST